MRGGLSSETPPMTRAGAPRESGEKEPVQVQSGNCPFLVPVMADWLWVCPTPVYCRRANGVVRVPGAQTLAHVCMSQYESCAGYRASVPRDEGNVC